MFPDVQWVDVGGGIGVVDREGGVPIDLAAVSTGLQVNAAKTRVHNLHLARKPCLVGPLRKFTRVRVHAHVCVHVHVYVCMCMCACVRVHVLQALKTAMSVSKKVSESCRPAFSTHLPHHKGIMGCGASGELAWLLRVDGYMMGTW
jgi:hypothetical protein